LCGRVHANEASCALLLLCYVLVNRQANWVFSSHLSLRMLCIAPPP
jgi:hypothetical protein